MTVLTSTSLSNPASSYLDDRYVVVNDPRPGTIVELGPGSQLAVRFRRGIGASRWHVAELPGHLLALPTSEGAGHEFQFLVFDSAGGSVPVRFERRHPDREIAHEVCELLVLPVTEAVTSDAGQRSKPA
jgi:hypothetical protein